VTGQTAGVVSVAHLADVTTVPASLDVVSSSGTAAATMPTLGARLAASSRAAQGFGPTVTDAGVLERLAELCALPVPRPPQYRGPGQGGSGTPDELDPAGK
jgi:hypothetical protein